MFERNTLFILGAGASIPYGFPSGAELRKTLCGGTAFYFGQLLRDVMFESEGAIQKFSETFLKSRQPSIDAFLAKRPDLEHIGKLAIAAQLIHLEKAESLFNADLDDDWYSALWNSLQDNAHTPTDVTRNAVRFVTFNYDRSLECFLHESIKNTWGLADQAAAAIRNGFKIIHVYGGLAPFSSIRSSEGRQYAFNGKEYEIDGAAKHLRVIPETREDDSVFETVREWADWADQICFLGFGFDPLNMHRLNLAKALEGRKRTGRPVYICASVFGKTSAEVRRIEERYFKDHLLQSLNHKNLMTLRESEILP